MQSAHEELQRIHKNEDFSKLLRKLRKQHQVNQESLADISGMHRNGISKIEQQNSDPKLSTMLNLLQLLGAELCIKFPKLENKS
jgi:transcriptional regulator with XRE-family HTH domain